MAGESWKTEGAYLDDVDFEVGKAWFGVREGDEQKRIGLHLTGIATEGGEVVDDEYNLFFSVGDGWELKKGGRAVSHVAGKTQFKRSTNMGRLIDAVAGIDEAVAVLTTRGEAYEADTWEGLIFHLEVFTNTYTDRNTKEEVKFQYTVPTEFVGVAGDSDGGSGGGKAKAAPAATRGRGRAAKEEVVEEAEAEAEVPKARGRGRAAAATETAPAATGRTRVRAKASNAVLRAAVVAFAGEFEDTDHDLFMEQVIDPAEFAQADELQNDEALLAEVMDPVGGIWKESR